MQNYIKVKEKGNKVHYIYIDLPEYLADQIFVDHGVPVHWTWREFVHDEHPYHLLCVKIRKQDEDRFIICMGVLRRKMLLMGHLDYDDICAHVVKHVLEYGKEHDEFTINRDALDEWEETDVKVHNLTTYLAWLEEHYPAIFAEMEETFEGLPGYGKNEE